MNVSGDKPILHPRASSTRTVSIVGTGSYAPEKVLTNADLEKMVDTSDEWIVTRTGMKQRRIARDDQATSDLAAEAAKKALADAGVTPEEVDMIVVATITPDMPFPNTACVVQSLIGAKNAFCLGLEVACSGFLYAVEVAQQFVASGAVETALVIAAEKMSSITDWEDRTTCILFGDGAGAAVLQAKGAQHGVLTSVMGSDGTLTDLLMVPAGGSRMPTTQETLDQRMHFLKMEGREVYKHAVTIMTNAAGEALEKCGLTMDDVDCIIPHQANSRIIRSIANRLKIPMERVFVNLEKYGNTSGASAGIALDEAAREGKIKKGDIVMILVFGGGFTWGATLLEWYK